MRRKRRRKRSSPKVSPIRRLPGRFPRSLMAMVVMTAALIIALGSAVMATDGQALVVGKTNTATRLTTLDRNAAGPALKVLVEAGSAPLAVTSSTKVANLNADKVDGKDSTAFLGKTEKAADAELLDGKDASDLTRVAQQQGGNRILSTSEQPFGQPLSITAPTDGFVRLSGNVSAQKNGGTSGDLFGGRIYHVESDTYSVAAVSTLFNVGAGGGTGYGNIALDAIFPVNAGVNTFETRLGRGPGDGSITAGQRQLTAEYTPYGSNGTGTLGMTAANQPLPRPMSPESRSVTVHPPDTGGLSLLLVASVVLFSVGLLLYAGVGGRM